MNCMVSYYDQGLISLDRDPGMLTFTIANENDACAILANIENSDGKKYSLGPWMIGNS